MKSISAALSAAVHKSINNGKNTGNIGHIVLTNEAKNNKPPVQAPQRKGN